MKPVASSEDRTFTCNFVVPGHAAYQLAYFRMVEGGIEPPPIFPIGRIYETREANQYPHLDVNSELVELLGLEPRKVGLRPSMIPISS
jgi:hypothetical protein